MKVSKTQLWISAKDYVFITLGIALYAFGFCGFILPEKVVIGGLAGIGTIVYFLTGVPVAITQLVINLLLLAAAYKVVGRSFVLGTIYGAVMISVFIGLFQPLFPHALTDEPFLNIVIGGTLCGIGIGTAFIHNGSTGGTDIVAAMVSKHTNVTLGRTILYTDFFIISSSYLITHSIEKIVFGFVVLFLVSFTIDMVVNTNRQAVQFTIFSRKWEEIATAINNDAHRGCTVLTGEGWFSKQPVKVLLVMCRKIEAVTISRIVKSIDPEAFLTQANVNGVYGKGFDELKVKMKAPVHSKEPAKKSPLSNEATA
ncbi:MAG: YitT family protein [Lachnospiraceae bacterium]|nr:YitT family protein [Lachnospiraceae bacterium]